MNRLISRHGAVLIEVMIALAILGIAGLSILNVVRETVKAQNESVRAERVIREADRVLAAVTLLKEVELAQAIGRQEIGEFTVDIQRPERGLYRLAIAEQRASDRTLLVTIVHRPEQRP